MCAKRQRIDGVRSDSDSDSDDDAVVGMGGARVCAPRPFTVPAVPASPPVELSSSDEEHDRRIMKKELKDGVASRHSHTRHHRRRTSGYHSSAHRRRKSLVVPECDTTARQRCFDYLVGAIDEVWAQYYDLTSSAETVLYDVELPNSPESLCDDSANESDSTAHAVQPTAGRAGHRASVSEQPKSLRLMNLKKRLLNAKYFMEDLVETTDVDAAAEFWHRWDMIKYAVVELVEEEGDDDDLVDEVCEDLEHGRFFPTTYC